MRLIGHLLDRGDQALANRGDLPGVADPVDIDFRGKPALLTPLLAWKMKSLASDVLLGYRHFIETGERRVPINDLKTRYRAGNPSNLNVEVQHA